MWETWGLSSNKKPADLGAAAAGEGGSTYAGFDVRRGHDQKRQNRSGATRHS
jgi:hypothetical protein